MIFQVCQENLSHVTEAFNKHEIILFYFLDLYSYQGYSILQVHLQIRVRNIKFFDLRNSANRTGHPKMRASHSISIHIVRPTEAGNGSRHSSGIVGSEDGGHHPHGRPLASDRDGLRRKEQPPLLGRLAKAQN